MTIFQIPNNLTPYLNLTITIVGSCVFTSIFHILRPNLNQTGFNVRFVVSVIFVFVIMNNNKFTYNYCSCLLSITLSEVYVFKWKMTVGFKA